MGLELGKINSLRTRLYTDSTGVNSLISTTITVSKVPGVVTEPVPFKLSAAPGLTLSFFPLNMASCSGSVACVPSTVSQLFRVHVQCGWPHVASLPPWESSWKPWRCQTTGPSAWMLAHFLHLFSKELQGMVTITQVGLPGSVMGTSRGIQRQTRHLSWKQQ